MVRGFGLLATSLICRGLKPEGFKTSPEYIQWHRDLGVGFYLQGNFPFKTIIENCEIVEEQRGLIATELLKPPKAPFSSVGHRWKIRLLRLPQSIMSSP